MQLEMTKTPAVEGQLRAITRKIVRQILLQLALIFVSVTVLFPVVWIVAMATDARNLPQYSELVMVPESFSFITFEKLVFEPFENFSSASRQIYFTHLLTNSLFVALGTAMLSVSLGASAAYAFSRFKFIGRQVGLLGFILLLMMPATGTLVPLIALFSLFKIHVVITAIAPAIFYGSIVALGVYGLNAAVRTFLKKDWVAVSNLRWLALAGVILFVFGLQFIGWMLLFRESEVYDGVIRTQLIETNDLRDEMQAIQRDIPTRRPTIPRRERDLNRAEQDLENVDVVRESAETLFPGAYTFAANLQSIVTTISNTASFQQQTLDQVIIPTSDPLQLRVMSLEAEVENAKQEVAEAIQAVKDREADLVEAQKVLDEAREPIIKLRNDIIADIVPYIVLTTLMTVIIAAALWLVWFQFNYRTHIIEVVRTERFRRYMLFGYLLIVILIAYAWFDSNYKSPTKAAGLEDGGLWYDIRITFVDAEDLEEELEPYNERDQLEIAIERLQTDGIETYREQLDTDLATTSDLITRLGAIDTELDPPDNLSRTQEIRWKDQKRLEINDLIEGIRSEARPLIGRDNRLNTLNNENLKTAMLEDLNQHREFLSRQLSLSESGDLETALSAFNSAIDRLPNDAEEEERLRKEYAVRSGDQGNVNETLKITLFGLMIAYSSGALPFAIWNLKGYFDTIPKELEEAALVDGANLITTFVRVILPLALPALAITILFSFMTGWTEFILATQFLSAGDAGRSTLAMALRGMTISGEGQPPPDYSAFAAMSILMAIPVITLFYIFQRWIVSGLTVGGVKG